MPRVEIIRPNLTLFPKLQEGLGYGSRRDRTYLNPYKSELGMEIRR